MLPRGSGYMLPRGSGYMLPRGSGYMLPRGSGYMLPRGSGHLRYEAAVAQMCSTFGSTVTVWPCPPQTHPAAGPE